MAAGTMMMTMLFFPEEVEELIQAASFHSPEVSAVEDLAEVPVAAVDSAALAAVEVSAAVVLREVGNF